MNHAVVPIGSRVKILGYLALNTPAELLLHPGGFSMGPFISARCYAGIKNSLIINGNLGHAVFFGVNLVLWFLGTKAVSFGIITRY